MLHEKSAGMIVYRLDPQEGIQYLLIYLRGDYWNFPKGHVDQGESEAEAAIRELHEETGLIGLKIIEGWRQQTQFLYKELFGDKAGQMIKKDLALYLAQLPAGQQVNLLVNEKKGERLNGYAWLPYKTAVKYLKFKNLREILAEADSYLKNLHS